MREKKQKYMKKMHIFEKKKIRLKIVFAETYGRHKKLVSYACVRGSNLGYKIKSSSIEQHLVQYVVETKYLN